MTTPSAKVVLDSISPAGDRLITFEGTMHRFVLAEFNTHRAFSRNSASSRAIPVKKQLDRVMHDPAIPVEWGKNQAGMQANELLSDLDAQAAMDWWYGARDHAVRAVFFLDRLGLHKQVANRLLEPFMWHTVVFTTTMAGLENFFAQRCTRFSPLAQPEMRAFADAVFEAYELSSPTLICDDEWHTPYIQSDEQHLVVQDKMFVSAARCARVSYLTHDGVRDLVKDLDLYDKLISAKPAHWSPLEHVATPGEGLGNFEGWVQLRHWRT